MAAADEGLHVVVTIASNGVVHAWGEGPVIGDPALVTPFTSRTRARAVAAKFRREEQADEDPKGRTVKVRVCKVLGIEPVEAKIDT